MVGLLVSLGAFAGYVEQHGDVAAPSVLARFEAVTTEVARRLGMTPAKTRDGAILLLGQTQESAIAAAYALADEFEPDDGYVPVHVEGNQGGAVRLEDGQIVHLAARIRLTGHPGQLQPGLRS